MEEKKFNWTENRNNNQKKKEKKKKTQHNLYIQN